MLPIWEEFEKPKIIVPTITDTVNLAPDLDRYYCNNKATIFVPESVLLPARLQTPKCRRGTARCSALPWLVTLSRHKAWTFSISGVLIVASFINMYWIMPRLNRACSADDSSACAETSRISKVLLWISAVIYLGGFSVAYALGPILTRLDH
jgi:hypothetical protein